ncbi:N-acetylglucosamine kinase [Streptomyces diastaticus]|uniref:N-acetylglucosamine kinase n=1 Tax=Streptomyces diastaticus TaxID=1956 RepID=UPI0036555C97
MSSEDESDLPAVLAIDGGSTKTDLALVGADGRLLGTVRGPGLAEEWSADETVAMLDQLVRQLARDVGLPGTSVVARHTSACLAHLDLPHEEVAITAAITSLVWSHSVLAMNDTFAVLRAGPDTRQDGGAGVAVVCGTGINCVGRDSTGRTTRFIGLGSVSGDWGGGNDLGAAALWWAARSQDGRGPFTLLQRTVPDHFGLNSMHQVQVAIRDGDITQFGQLAPLVLDAATADDGVGRKLVERQADEICTMALLALRRLDLLTTPVPVVLGGSVVAARHEQLTDAVHTGMAAGSKAVVHILDAPPIVGAILWGLDAVGSALDAELRVRHTYQGG